MVEKKKKDRGDSQSFWLLTLKNYKGVNDMMRAR
jgi:hypothetical protein